MAYEILSNTISFYPLMLLLKLLSCCPYLDFSRHHKKKKKSWYPLTSFWCEYRNTKLCYLYYFPWVCFIFHFFSKRYFWRLNNDKSQHFSPRNFLPKTMLPCSISPSTLIKCHMLSTVGSLFPVTLVGSKSLLWGTKGSFPLTQSLLLFKQSKSTEENYKPISVSIYICVKVLLLYVDF